MKCNYCHTPDAVVEHRELKCTEHLSKCDQCPNAPEPVRKEALKRLATKRGVLSSAPIDELGSPVNPHVVSDDNDDGILTKKGKAVDGTAMKRKQGTMDTFVDRGLSNEEKAQVDFVLLRYVFSAATHVNVIMTYHQSNYFL
jgi:hypothetical protein